MKQFLLSLFLVGVFVGAVVLADNTLFVELPPPSPSPTSTPVPIPTLEKMKLVEMEDGSYRYSLGRVSDVGQLILGQNFENKMSTERIIEREDCGLLVNGGFYAEDDTPIGWLLIDGEEISGEQRNALFDGRLWVASDSASISTVVDDQARIGLQSGPLLIVDGEEQLLSIKGDEERRRVVAVLTHEEELIFVVVAGEEYLSGGPMLASLPGVLMDIAEMEDFEIADAINLDGGTASAFYSQELYVREMSFVGTYFCLKESVNR